MHSWRCFISVEGGSSLATVVVEKSDTRMSEMAIYHLRITAQFELATFVH